MKIKRFEAPDNITAFALVKKELGENAVILSSKTLEKGSRNARFEVIAAMDYELETVTAPPTETARQKAPSTYGDHSFRGNVPKQKAEQKDRGEINFESRDLKMRFSRMLKEQTRKEGLKKPAQKNKSAEKTKVEKWRDSIIDQIHINPLKIKKSTQPEILALVGPTGVGKTTSAAKLAAWFSLRENCRVTLLSMDCYRIGATDQLRTYARIMRLPCEIVLRKKDLADAISRHQDSDLIIIDTAGKSPYDPDHVAELKNWFAPFDSIQPYLVLSASTKKEDIKTIINSYTPLDIASLIISKVDETRTYATLCQEIATSSLPVSYLACGQRVPEDFLAASRPYLHTLFKKGWQGFAAMLNRTELKPADWPLTA
ncbi:MAG: AAA family ATPase [Thermodesulfobacteriota bacterium]|nr:AAA family ATPase [Thermodesulfobacteriota bacterium]